jgi:ribonuclease G
VQEPALPAPHSKADARRPLIKTTPASPGSHRRSFFMSKELVISAGSHERRVAILEEGSLVEIYIEREKEFALVGSIYKGKVTRVLPGMQSAFVEIGLDGDAFLYVSDVFENLEDYDHGHAHDVAVSAPQALAPAGASSIELLPGETLHAAHTQHEEILSLDDQARGSEHDSSQDVEPAGAEEHVPGTYQPELENDAQPIASGELDEAQPQEEAHGESDERQPESNASAPQNFAPRYNPTQNYPRAGGDRGRQNFGRGNDRGQNAGDRGGDGGRGGRWGRRGGRRRSGSGAPPSGGSGGRPQGPGNAGPGRNLPPSKYASPQGESRGPEPGNFDPRGRDNRGAREDRGDRGDRGQPRGGPSRGFEPRRGESTRHSSPSAPHDPIDEPILLPGESLAKYRAKPVGAVTPPALEHEPEEKQPERDDLLPNRPSTGAPSGMSGGSAAAGVVPRRFSGGLPRWLLADAGSESEGAAEAAQESIAGGVQTPEAATDAASAIEVVAPLELPAASLVAESEPPVRGEVDLNEDQVASLSSEFAEAKHEETQKRAAADAVAGGAVFEEVEEEVDVEEDEESEEHSVSSATEEEDVEEAADGIEAEEESFERADSVQTSTASERSEAEADAAHEDAHADAEHVAALAAQTDSAESEQANFSSAPAFVEEESILLPGETRAPRAPGAPREEFPRESARVGGGNPRSRFQRPFRGGGRDRGPRRDGRGDYRSGPPRDRGDRGGDNRSLESRGPDTRGTDSRGARPDNRGGRPDRGGRPGQRFERRPGGGQHRGHGHSGPSRRPQLISEMLKAGQDVVVQIAKEPLGKKGARITSHVALPGRFLVYMPTIDHIGVSRKIESADNRSRLRRLVGEARGSYPGGFIVRTAAGGATDEEIRTDIDFLGKTWNEIKQKSEERKAPALLHRDLNLVERILRDYVSDDFTAIWIDNEEEYGKVVEFVSRFQPKLVNRVKLYTKEQPIFEEFGIQHELDKALRAKVWLKSGGYIVINHTEALVAIDVNTGKFVGKGSIRLEDTIVKTNLEAVKEIVRQIRLRDLGGIIVVDFIDMEERRNREKVLSALQNALEQDKAPSKALSFNEFGLVCITRKRTKQALERVLCQPCPYCTGSGMVKSIPTLCYEIQAEARKMAAADHESPNLTLRVNPEIAKALKTRESMLMDELEQTSHKHVIIQSDPTLHWEQYDIY